MKVHAPSDKRFKRARAHPGAVRGSRAGRWMRVAAAVVLGAVLFGSGFQAVRLALSSGWLVVGRIDVGGTRYLSRGEVLSLLDGLQGRNMLRVDLGEWQERLRASSWVEQASLRRVLPGRISVTVVEREPLGVARLGQELYLIDRGGVVIDAYGPNYAELDLPIISGLAPAGTTGGARVGEARARLVTRVLDTLGARRGLASRISELDVSNLQDAVVTLKDDPVVLHLGDEDFDERLQSYVELSATLRERVPAIEYVDMRFDERVFVGPRAARPGRADARPATDVDDGRGERSDDPVGR
ncbi:MAG: FtsQ-type POTRA domain-containing protein [Acidimicrobiia bacterium]|nr:FtsQ-type POTRA domain-containing protein [Acidimicrobiia bacterium]